MPSHKFDPIYPNTVFSQGTQKIRRQLFQFGAQTRILNFHLENAASISDGACAPG